MTTRKYLDLNINREENHMQGKLNSLSASKLFIGSNEYVLKQWQTNSIVSGDADETLDNHFS